MNAASDLSPGSLVGPYELLSLLGEGGMGRVYRARDERLSREVALKLVRAELAEDLDRLKRFEHEAKAAGALNHPNIVAIYDTGQSDGSPYIVSELLQGETLRDRLATGALGARKAVEYGVQIARGLAAAHERGIVHRDLKPENLFLTKDGLVKILDFGIAKLGRAGEERAGSEGETLSGTGTNPGTMLGTVGYMSPEQVRGLPADHRSDVFSFGAVLFEMLTGRRAFKSATAADTLSAILREDPTEALGTAAVIPPGLLRVVRRCLEKAPADRFQTARDLAFALEGATTEPPRPVTGDADRSRERRRGGALLVGVAALAAAGLLGAWLAWRSVPGRPVPPSFQRLTFRVGNVESARFAPDRETIVYGAKWGSSPSELYSTRAGATASRALGIKDALILRISAREEMALLLRPRTVTWSVSEGTLARAPLAGGTPREVLEGVVDADWSPDGKDLAVIHVVGERYRLEYPIGKILYESEPPAAMGSLSVSRAGDTIAFIEHPVAGDVRAEISIVGPKQAKRTIASGYAAANDIRWSPRGDEVWFSASEGGPPRQLHAVTLAGRKRVVFEQAGPFALLDLSARGQALLSSGIIWMEIRARARGAVEETELPAAELSFLSDLSDDGSLVLGTDVGQGAGSNFSFYVQKTDGSPAVWLGEGDGQALSPDGRFALAVLAKSQPQQLVIVPTAAGDTRTLEAGPIVRYVRAVWDPSGRRVVIAGADASDRERLYVQDVGGGAPTPATDEGVTLAKLGRPVSPDGQRVVALGPDEVPAIYPLGGGEPTPVPGLGDDDVPLCWTPDGRELMIARYGEDSPVVERVEVATGRTHRWAGPPRSLPAAHVGESRILVTPDGRSYAYGHLRSLNGLYLSSPLQ